jgi:hypothetical protein
LSNEADRADGGLWPPGVEPTADFLSTLEFVQKTRGNLFVTGRAGTGKSTLLRVIVLSLDGEVVIGAPTGIAALNVGGQTLHSLSRLPRERLLLDGEENQANPRDVFAAPRSSARREPRLQVQLLRQSIFPRERANLRMECSLRTSPVSCWGQHSRCRSISPRRSLFCLPVCTLVRLWRKPRKKSSPLRQHKYHRRLRTEQGYRPPHPRLCLRAQPRDRLQATTQLSRQTK